MSDEYRVEIDQVDREQWGALLDRFLDASLYQTWEYGAVRWDEANSSHVVLYRGEEPVAAAQARIAKLPVLGGIAHMRSGPLWRRRDAEDDLEHLRRIVRAMREEYVRRRGLVLRMIPHAFDDRPEIGDLLVSEDLVHKRRAGHTVMVDLAPPIEDIRKNLVARWRTDLNRSERGELEWIEGADLELYTRFEALYEEMHDRKGFAEFVSVDQFRQLQRDLPERHKMSIAMCLHEGRPVAGAITAPMGETAMAIFWATSPEGRDVRGAYFLHWRLVEHFKQAGFRWYDTAGIDKESNPGSYRFKTGLGGKQARDVWYLGEYEAEPKSVGTLLVRAGDLVRTRYRAMRERLGARRSSRATAC